MGPVFAIINQQFMTGCNLGQQGVFAEMSGNYPGAAQSYDQAIAWIYQSMATALQSGAPVPDHVHYAIGCAHFSAARVKNLLGSPPMALSHLNQSLAALNQAIALNPQVGQYHVAVGTVLMALGNLPEAQRAFLTALQINPSDPWAQYMLALLNSAGGNMTAANQYYAAVRQMAPNLPQMPAMFQTGQKTDWLAVVHNVCGVLKAFNEVSQTFGNFQNASQQF